MRLALLTVAAVVVLPVATLASEVAALPQQKTFAGKRVELDRAPTTQHRGGVPVGAVGDAIGIGAYSFPVKVQKGKLRVAKAPDGSPTRTVDSSRVETLEWRADRVKHTVHLRFHRDADQAWTYHAAYAYSFAIGGETLRLFDLNADGRYDEMAVDGWSTHDSNVVLPLEQSLIVGPNRVEIESIDPGGASLVATVRPLHGTPGQVNAVWKINTFRAAHGLAPVDLDEDLSRACTAHGKYLATNRWSHTTNPHTQNLGPKGASEEGAEAASRSIISGGSPAGAIAGFWITYYHRIGLMSPGLTGVGVNAEPANLSVIDVAQYYDRFGETDWPWADPVVVPADGSVGTPTRSSAELPKEPVRNLGARGFPIMAVFHVLDPSTFEVGVSEFTGTLEALTGDKAVAVKVLDANPGDFPYCRGIVPAQPLQPETWYRATLTWKRNGKDESRVVNFRTRKERKKRPRGRR